MGSTAGARESEDTLSSTAAEPGLSGVLAELHRLRQENRRLAISLGGFSAFIASKGLLEDAWDYVHRIHQIEEGDLQT